MTRYRLITPPPTLRRAKLDNLALVPGSLLPYREQWQAIANSLPRGDVLIVLPSSDQPSNRTLQDLAARLQAKGRHVTILAVDDLQPSAL